MTAERSVRWAVAAGFLLVATQRLAVPFGDGGIQVPLLVVLAVCGHVVLTRSTPVDPAGLVRFLLLLAVGGTCLTVGMTAHPGAGVSVLSLGLLAATYLPAVLRSHGPDADAFPGSALFRGVLGAVKLGAVGGLVQHVAQALGRGYWDPVAALPEPLLVAGFNSHYAVQHSAWGSGIGFKPNGVVFLEPSFLSLYAGLGIVVLLHRVFVGRAAGASADRADLGWLLVLSLALATSASTSGLVVMAAGGLVLAFRVRRNRVLVVVLLGGLVALLSVGVFDAIIDKAREGVTGDTSSALRLVTPYVELTRYWLERPLLGWGPGMAGTFAEASGIRGLQTTTVLKALIEYGLVGTAVLAAVIGVAVRRSTAPLAVTSAVFAAWLLPSEALLNPILVMLLLVVLPSWSTGRQQPAPPASDRHDRRVLAV